MKKKGLCVWTTVTIVSIVLAIAAFLFTGVTDCVSLYSKRFAEFSWLSFATIFQPLVFGWDAFVHFQVRWLTISVIVVLGLFVIGTIVLFIMMAKKKKWQYLGQFFVLLFTAFVGVYLLCYVFDTKLGGSMSIARQMITFGEPYNLMIKFGINTIGSILFYVMLLMTLIAVISVFAMYILTINRLAKVRVNKSTAAVEEKVETKTPATAVEEEKKEEPAKPKKKVVLVVKRYDGFKNPYEKPIEKETNYPHEKLEVEPLTRDDIRRALSEELDARAKKEEVAHPLIKEEPTPAIQEHLSVSEADAVKEDKNDPQIPTPVIIAIPTPVKEAEEKPAKVAENVEKEPSLTKEQVRDIIREELLKAIEEIKNQEPEVVEEVVEEVHEIKVAVEEKVEEPKPVETKAEENKVEEPAPEVKEEKVEEVKAEEPAPAPEEENTEDEATKIERIPFAQRIREADPETKDNYNQIKSLLVSYGLKNRTSNGGDAFRLHKVTYCKVTVAGKSLKLYLALDPADYKNTTLPIKDASSKAIYKDIPLVFKVKSGLSLRRAEQLITEMMDKHGIEQIDRVEVKDYASTLENTSDDEGDDD